MLLNGSDTFPAHSVSNMALSFELVSRRGYSHSTHRVSWAGAKFQWSSRQWHCWVHAAKKGFSWAKYAQFMIDRILEALFGGCEASRWSGQPL